MEGESMGISSVGTLENAAISRSRMAVQRAEVRQNRGTGQKAAAQPADVVSKNIQNEISEVQRQKQGLSSKQEMSEGERSKKKQELQQELDKVLADKEIGIVLLTEKFGEKFPDLINEVKLNHKLPLFVEIPDRHGTGRKPDFITSYVNEAIGLKL